MAYNLKYYNEFTSRHYKRLVRVEILERDYSGVAEQIKMGASIGLSDSGDGREEPIKKLTASLRLVSERNFQFEHLFTSDDRKYQVKIKRNGITIFIGFLESDSYSEPYYSWKGYTVNLTARDNLGRLEDIPYLMPNRDRATGLEGAASVISRVLDYTGYFLNLGGDIGLRSSDMSSGSTTLQQTLINNDAFWDFEKEKPLNCLDVLTSIIKGFGSQIRQMPLSWLIVDQAKFYDQPTIQGNSASFPSHLADKLNFPKIDKAFKWINRDAEMSILPAWKEFEIEQDYKTSETIFRGFPKSNNDFIQGAKLSNNFPYITSNEYYYGALPNWNMNGNDIIYNPLNPTFVILPESSSDYIERDLSLVKATNKGLFIKMPYSASRIRYGNYIDNSVDVFVDIFVVNGSDVRILTDEGWKVYTSQNKELKFNNIPLSEGTETELTLITDGIPIDGQLKIRLWGGGYDSILGLSGVKTIHDINVSFSNAYNSKVLNADIDSNNNISEDSIDFMIGQVPNETNANIKYLGGLFSAAGVAQVDWKRDGDSTAETLLKKVAIGYDLQNRQPARQINGTVLWDWDLWTNIDDQNKRLMINSADWDMNTDEMSAEFVEVFEYKNTLGSFNDGYSDGFDNSDAEDYKTNTIFELTQKTD